MRLYRKTRDTSYRFYLIQWAHMFSSLHAIEEYLQELVPKTSQMQFTGEKGIIRTKELLKLLGSPQNTLKVVHVAGTSGKGSTSFMISHLLVSQGFKVGLHLSPHLLDLRERTEINNTLLEEKKYCTYFNEIVPSIEKMRNSPFGALTYFEALVGFTFYVFKEEKVDYAVMETGLGGEFDGTNVVDRTDKLAVITRIGFDHMKVLGNTLTKIAYQKAMICAEKGDLITIKDQAPSVEKEILRVVKEKKGCFVRSFGSSPQDDREMELGLLGEYQKENASLALAALSHLSKRDGFIVQVDSVRSVMKSLRFKGRFDVIQKKGGSIILDGAHNAQKMKAFLTSVNLLFPGKKFTFIIAFKQGKDYKKMLKYIVPFAQKIIVTHIFSESQDILHLSVPLEKIKSELDRLGFTQTQILTESENVMKIIKQEGNSCIVTGSLYLLGDVYKLL